MANNTDLVSELRIIENWFKRESEKYRGDSIAMDSAKSRMLAFADTLQRARDALRWIPVEERLPEKPDLYDTSYGDDTSVLWFDGRAFHGDAQAWRERPTPYTPEEVEK